MKKPIEMIGKKFGALTVLERDSTKPSGAGKAAYWLCECECGNIKSFRGTHLRAGEIKSCGCKTSELRSESRCDDLTGQRFGKLTVIEKDKTVYGNGAKWFCKCDCGREILIYGRNLKAGTKSCGCLTSKGEFAISKILVENEIEFKTQVIFEDLVGWGNCPLRFDFGIYKDNILKYLIEFQGIQHFQQTGFKNSEEKFKKQNAYDKLKKDYCEKNNIELIILDKIEQVCYNNIIINELLED